MLTIAPASMRASALTTAPGMTSTPSPTPACVGHGRRRADGDGRATRRRPARRLVTSWPARLSPIATKMHGSASRTAPRGRRRGRARHAEPADVGAEPRRHGSRSPRRRGPAARRTSIDTSAWPPPPTTSTPTSISLTVVQPRARHRTSTRLVRRATRQAGANDSDDVRDGEHVGSSDIGRVDQHRATAPSGVALARPTCLRRHFPRLQYAVDAAVVGGGDPPHHVPALRPAHRPGERVGRRRRRRGRRRLPGRRRAGPRPLSTALPLRQPRRGPRPGDGDGHRVGPATSSSIRAVRRLDRPAVRPAAGRVPRAS